MNPGQTTRALLTLSKRASRSSLLSALIILWAPSSAWGQTCPACYYCNSMATVRLLGCALAGTDCSAQVQAWLNACLENANPLPASPPPPPEPETPCTPAPLPESVTGGKASRTNPGRRTAGASVRPCIVVVDPNSTLVNQSGADLLRDPESLATLGTDAVGIVADSAARLLLRIYTNSVGDQVTVTIIESRIR